MTEGTWKLYGRYNDSSASSSTTTTSINTTPLQLPKYSPMIHDLPELELEFTLDPEPMETDFPSQTPLSATSPLAERLLWRSRLSTSEEADLRSSIQDALHDVDIIMHSYVDQPHLSVLDTRATTGRFSDHLEGCERRRRTRRDSICVELTDSVEESGASSNSRRGRGADRKSLDTRSIAVISEREGRTTRHSRHAIDTRRR